MTEITKQIQSKQWPKDAQALLAMFLYPTYLASYCQGLKVGTPNIPISRLSPCNRARLLKSSSCRRHEVGHCASTHFKRPRNHFSHEMIDNETGCWEWRRKKTRLRNKEYRDDMLKPVPWKAQNAECLAYWTAWACNGSSLHVRVTVSLVSVTKTRPFCDWTPWYEEMTCLITAACAI